MPRRPPLSRLPLVAAALALTACTSGPSRPAPPATGPVAVPVPSAPGTAACRTLIASLPDQLEDGVRRRPVTGDPTRTAAWGDPAVTLQCGVPPPDPTRTPLVIDGFPLIFDERGNAVTYTTADREVSVAVRIPKSYEDQAYLVLSLIPQLRRLPGPAASPAA